MAEGGRTERLAAVLRDAAQRALERGQWDEAAALAGDLLADDPTDTIAATILDAAERHGSTGATDQGRRYLTVMFSDVVGSTSMSERFDPEDYLEVISKYRDVVRQAVESHDGHIDQFQGDGVVAYFGYPSATEDEQVRAIEAGLAIVEAVRVAGEQLRVDLAARVGIHVGRTVMTSVGLGARNHSAAIGFAANVAARIQGEARPGTVVVSESVADVAGRYFELVPVGSRELRGVSDDVHVFEVTSPRSRSTVGDRRLATPLVGRTAERARIEAAWQAAKGASDDERILVLVGEPGIGKSRLARHAAELAHADAANLIEINCGRDLRHVGLGAVRRGIERALWLPVGASRAERSAALEARGTTVGLTAPTVAVLEALLGESAPALQGAELAPDRLREAIITALLEWITAEAAAAPTALLVEDLQWADDTAIETIRRLTAVPLPPGLFVLLTARAGEVPVPLRARLADATLELGPLTRDDTAAMVRAFAATGALDDVEVERLAQRSEGVPLFTEHLVMAATTSSHASGSAELPETLEGLLQARLASTGPGRGVAEVASVIGRDFSVDIVEGALTRLGARAPVPPEGARAALRVLERTGLIESEGGDRMRFRHTLVRDVAYEMQLRTDRSARHGAVATALVQRRGEDAPATVLAYHHERAGNIEPAAASHLRAAEQAADLAEWELALGHLRSAVELSRRIAGSAGHRVELAACMQVGAVSAASFSYARAEAEDAYTRALELCDLIAVEDGHDAGLDLQLLTALGGLWSKEVVSGDLPAARRVTERLERLTSSASDLDPEITRFTLGCRGFEQLYGGETSAAVVTLEAASERGVAGPVSISLGTPHDYIAAADALLAVGYTLVGDDAGADQALDRALARSGELAFPVGPFSEAVVGVYEAYVHRLRGDAAAARRAADRVQGIGEEHGFQEHTMLGQMLGLAARVMEEDVAATFALESTLSIWRMAGGGLAVPVLLAELAAGCLAIDDLERAGTALDDATAMMATTEQRGSESEVLRLRAAIERRTGASDEAVVKGLVAAADLALAQGAVRLAGRAMRDLADVTDSLPPAAVDVTNRFLAAVPPSAAGDLRAVERRLSGTV